MHIVQFEFTTSASALQELFSAFETFPILINTCTPIISSAVCIAAGIRCSFQPLRCNANRLMASSRPAVSAVCALAPSIDYRCRIVTQRTAVKFAGRHTENNTSVYILGAFVVEFLVVFHNHFLQYFYTTECSLIRSPHPKNELNQNRLYIVNIGM